MNNKKQHSFKKNSEKFRLGNGRETLKEKKEQCVYAIAYKPGRK
jgi:hypothetical protein